MVVFSLAGTEMAANRHGIFALALSSEVNVAEYHPDSGAVCAKGNWSYFRNLIHR